MCTKKEFEIRSTLFCNKVILPYLLEFWKCHLFIRKENINIQKMCLIKIPFEFVCYYLRGHVIFMLFFECSGNFYVNRRKRKKNKQKEKHGPA